MQEPNLDQYTREMLAMQTLPPASVQLPPLAVVAIISHIQAAVRHPGIAGTGFSKVAIDVAKQLQQLFNSKSETYKVLELGWDLEADFHFPTTNSEEPFEGFCKEPCDNFVKNLGCRCTGYQVAEVVAGAGDIDPKTLAAGAAMMHQIKKNLQSEGSEFLDM